MNLIAVFDCGHAQSDYSLGPVFDCGQGIEEFTDLVVIAINAGYAKSLNFSSRETSIEYLESIYPDECETDLLLDGGISSTDYSLGPLIDCGHVTDQNILLDGGKSSTDYSFDPIILDGGKSRSSYNRGPLLDLGYVNYQNKNNCYGAFEMEDKDHIIPEALDYLPSDLIKIEGNIILDGGLSSSFYTIETELDSGNSGNSVIC